MNMTDMLLQMTLQSAWQVSQSGQSGQTAAAQDNQGTSFQDLLNQRRDDLNQTETGNSDVDGTKDAQSTDTSVKPDQDQPDEDLQTLASAAPVVLSSMLPAQQVVNGQSVAVENVAVQAVVSQTAATAAQQGQNPLPQTGETAVAVQPEQNGQTAEQNGQSGVFAAETQTPSVGVAQANGSGERSGAQGELSQNLAQSADTQGEGDPLEGAQVEHWSTPLFRDVEASPVRVGDGEGVDMTAPDQQVDQALTDKLKGALSQGEQRVEIKLTPANLGTVTAEFTRTPEGALHVVLHAESEQTARLLSDHANSLGMMLQDSTRAEVRVQVAQPQENQSAWQHPDQDGGQQQQRQQSQQQHSAPSRDSETFLHQLRLGLVQTESEAG